MMITLEDGRIGTEDTFWDSVLLFGPVMTDETPEGRWRIDWLVGRIQYEALLRWGYWPRAGFSVLIAH